MAKLEKLTKAEMDAYDVITGGNSNQIQRQTDEEIKNLHQLSSITFSEPIVSFPQEKMVTIAYSDQFIIYGQDTLKEMGHPIGYRFTFVPERVVKILDTLPHTFFYFNGSRQDELTTPLATIEHAIALAQQEKTKDQLATSLNNSVA